MYSIFLFIETFTNVIITLHRHTLCYGTVHKILHVCCGVKVEGVGRWGDGQISLFYEELEEVLIKTGIGLVARASPCTATYGIGQR